MSSGRATRQYTGIDFIVEVLTIKQLTHKGIVMADKIKGTVKWFNDSKGFGFIESSGKDYFVHFSAVLTDGFKTLTEGAAVMFKPNQGKKGIEALEVELI